jgi:hypothetical protein
MNPAVASPRATDFESVAAEHDSPRSQDTLSASVYVFEQRMGNDVTWGAYLAEYGVLGLGRTPKAASSAMWGLLRAGVAFDLKRGFSVDEWLEESNREAPPADAFCPGTPEEGLTYEWSGELGGRTYTFDVQQYDCRE